MLTQKNSSYPTLTSEQREKYRQVVTFAQQLYRQGPDWVSFFREVLGVDGVVRRSFSTLEELTSFERSEYYEAIQTLIVKLREKRVSADPETEPTRVITVRLPKSMHEYLRTEAHDLHTSMNKLCISKLLQMIEQKNIPNDRTATPKRTPAPAAAVVPTPQPANSLQSIAAPQRAITPQQQPASQQRPATYQQPTTTNNSFAKPAPFKSQNNNW